MIASSKTEQKDNRPRLEEEKEKLQRDARELAENFKDVFKDLTGISKAILYPFVEDVSEWIQENYAELNRQGRKNLKNALEELGRQMSDLENQSREKTRELFKDFRDLLNGLKEKREQPSSDLVPA